MAKKKRPQTPGQISSAYEKRLLANQIGVERRIVDLHTSIINEIAQLAAIQKMPKGVFTLAKLATLNTRLDFLISRMNANYEVIVHNGINDAWALSNEKNNMFADIRLAKSVIPIDRQVVFYDTNATALKAFTDRTVAGLNLSERIYKSGEIFKAELEAGIGLGISKGQSAAELGRDLRQYLKEPNLLFRRVRDEAGNLQLSKRAEYYNPGQGVYRSSRANIQRLTRTEINTAYRTSDNKRWQQMPFMLGQEIHLSAQHPKYDICDAMVGDYPVEFIFIGWHPQCICFSVPKLMSDEQFNQYQKLFMAGEATPANVAQISKPVMDIPAGASEWIENNKERVAGWKSTPLWWQQNTKYVPEIK